MNARNHRCRVTDAGDHERGLVLFYEHEILLQPRVAGVHDKVDGVGRAVRAAGFAGDARQPCVKVCGRPGIEAWERADDTGIAACDHKVRAGYKKHRSDDRRQLQLRSQVAGDLAVAQSVLHLTFSWLPVIKVDTNLLQSKLDNQLVSS